MVEQLPAWEQAKLELLAVHRRRRLYLRTNTVPTGNPRPELTPEWRTIWETQSVLHKVKLYTFVDGPNWSPFPTDDDNEVAVLGTVSRHCQCRLLWAHQPLERSSDCRSSHSVVWQLTPWLPMSDWQESGHQLICIRVNLHRQLAFTANVVSPTALTNQSSTPNILLLTRMLIIWIIGSVPGNPLANVS